MGGCRFSSTPALVAVRGVSPAELRLEAARMAEEDSVSVGEKGHSLYDTQQSSNPPLLVGKLLISLCLNFLLLKAGLRKVIGRISINELMYRAGRPLAQYLVTSIILISNFLAPS